MASKNFKPWKLRVGYSPPHLSSFFTKKAILINGLYDNQFKIAGDFEFFVRCFLKNRFIYKLINECFIVMSTGGLSGKNFNSYLLSSKEINIALKIINKVCVFSLITLIYSMKYFFYS